MNRRAVIDTSVMFKWFVAYGESGIDEAWSLLERHKQGELTLVAPASAIVEVANLLRYIGIGVDDAQALMVQFLGAHVVVFESNPARVRRALACAFEHRISVYDAQFLALAQELECSLVTADRSAFGSLSPDVAQVQLIL
jgi:predicted nucleic acid-binding protein